MGKKLSPEHRRRISRGVSRNHERRRLAAEVRPAHVDRWRREGVVAPQLAPILAARAGQVEAMVADLGGPSETSAMERGVLEGWFQAMVGADVEFARLARGEASEVPERLATCLNAARAALVALGLRRRAREVDFTKPLRVEWDTETAQEAPDGAETAELGPQDLDAQEPAGDARQAAEDRIVDTSGASFHHAKADGR